MNNSLRTGRAGSGICFNIVVYAWMVFIGAITLYPFINVLALSLNTPYDTVRGGIYLFPRVLTLSSYTNIFQTEGLLNAFTISVIRTIVGAVTTVFCSTMLAFVISRKDFVLTKFISVLLVITMYVSGGLIPSYMLIRNLGLMGSFWVYILPNLVGVWSVLVTRSFIDKLPPSILESAKLDGVNDFKIYIRIILPLCIPVLATMSLFAAVWQWNQWIDTYLYNNSRPELSTLQFEMMKMLLNIESLARLAKSGNTKSTQFLTNQVSPESIRMAMTIVATLPILVVYPFLQKYFVSGLTLGSVKG